VRARLRIRFGAGVLVRMGFLVAIHQVINLMYGVTQAMVTQIQRVVMVLCSV
jgi:hypothetical protein